MLKIGDLVKMPEDKYENQVYGIIVGFDREMYGLKFFKIYWFDDETSSESVNDIVKVETDE